MNTCIGIFDSGMGGLSVLNRVVERHGDLPCIYLADTARIPFGNKSPSEIRSIAKELVDWLKYKEVSIVLVACNTTNSLAFDIVESLSGIEVIGLIKSVDSMIINESRIGVLATPATAASKAYSCQIKSLKPQAFVLEQGCPDLVPLIEAGKLNTEEIKLAAKEYLKPLLKAGVESIVLGCSHYPLLVPLLRQLLPINVRLIDPAVGLAEKLDDFLGPPEESQGSPISIANTRICVTSSPSAFANRVQNVLGNCPEVELVSLKSDSCFF